MKSKFIVKALLLMGTPWVGSSFEYFDSDIDYWGEESKRKVPSRPQEKAPRPSPKAPSPPAEGGFSWKKKLDPKNKEFFQEGGHTPPEEIVELMRDPSEKNIKNWFLYIEKKNKLAQTMHQKIQEYLKKNEEKIKQEEASQIRIQAQTLTQAGPDFDRFVFRLYFESSCPHCQRMIKTMKQLRDMGYYVEIRQIDEIKNQRNPLPFPVVQATQEELKKKNISSWPVLLVADREKKLIYRVNGYQSKESVLEALRTR